MAVCSSSFDDDHVTKRAFWMSQIHRAAILTMTFSSQMDQIPTAMTLSLAIWSTRLLSKARRYVSFLDPESEWTTQWRVSSMQRLKQAVNPNFRAGRAIMEWRWNGATDQAKFEL
jgi:hypothetical protein